MVVMSLLNIMPPQHVTTTRPKKCILGHISPQRDLDPCPFDPKI